MTASLTNFGVTRRSTLAIGGMAALAVPFFASAQGVSPTVQTSKGVLRGFSDRGVSVFKGIRYGQDTRRSRFSPPIAATAWTGVQEAHDFGPACPQTHADEPTSEDCLFLNLWAPAARPTTPSSSALRPVLVYIHGGEYSHGSGSDPLYDGAQLAADQDLVVVTLNHRLNVFGHLFLGMMATDARRHSGNVGLLDLILALTWIRDEIAAFGGNPGCVTLIGQSGGGAKIATLMAMPQAHGLFHRAVTMSGQQVTASGPLAADHRARVVLDRLNLAPSNLSGLDALSVSQLIEASQAQDPTLSGSVYFGPVVDGENLPRHPFWPTAPELSSTIPMIIGGTRDEVRIFFRAEQGLIAKCSWEEMTARLGRELRIDCDPRKVVSLYRRLRPEASPEEVFYSAVTDSRSWRGAVLEAEARMDARAPTFVYQVNFESPLEGGHLKACHMIDIPLVFGTTKVPGALSGDSAQARQLSRQMQAMLGRFARTGDPNGPGLPAWPAYGLAHRPTLVLDAESACVADPRSAERRFFAAYPFIQRGTI